ncbi:hypothetical protein IAU60_005083 [Kwoniella sp. DSM 27419]
MSHQQTSSGDWNAAEHLSDTQHAAAKNATQATGGDPTVPPADGRCSLLELPGEVLSQIASYLPLGQLVPFLSLHPLLLSLTQSHLSPLPPAIRAILSRPPYPQALSVLPHLSRFLPPDQSDAERLLVQVLVRAQPRWLMERFEFGRWSDRLWQEAFERRFLRSWRRIKGDGDSWRAVFLRMLSRMDHRQSGCTHEESWTRFVTLHRNGTASINRIYSRTFDPYEIYAELKHQNNFSAHPTTVRVVCQLQDVRILAVGVLIDQPSLFVNPNAHLALHPPLLRHLSSVDDESYSHRGTNGIHDSRWFRSSVDHTPSGKNRASAGASPGITSNEAYFPLVRSVSPSTPQSTTYGLSVSDQAAQGSTNGHGEPGPRFSGTSSTPWGPIGTVTAGGPSSTASGSLRSAIASYIPMPGRRRMSTANDIAGSSSGSNSGTNGHGGALTLVRSRDSDDGGRRRTWSFGRTRTASTAGQGQGITFAQLAGQQGIQAEERPEPQVEVGSAASGANATVNGHSLPALNEVPSNGSQRHDDPKPSRLSERPYDVLQYPQPAVTHLGYPNITRSDDGFGESDQEVLPRDLRGDHPEIEDEYEGGLWGGDVSWGAGGTRMAEWDESSGKRKRWVGPMILMAQIHPSTQTSAHPPGVDPAKPLEGPNIDLGARGTYASLGFEDLADLFPWIDLKGSGAWDGEARRSGLGF